MVAMVQRHTQPLSSGRGGVRTLRLRMRIPRSRQPNDVVGCRGHGAGAHLTVAQGVVG